MVNSSLTAREIELIVSGIKSLSILPDEELFRSTLSSVLQTLRGADDFNSLDFIVSLWGTMPHSMHLLLWPFVVNELLLVGMSSKQQSFYDATEIASHMHKEGMFHLRMQLEEMDAFQKKEVAEIVFRPAFVYSYPLFAFLLQTSLRDILIEKVHQAFIEQPEDPFIEAIAPILDISVTSHLHLLRAYMEQAHMRSLPLPLKMEAGSIILEYLQTISDSEREQPWLVKTIEATVGMGVEGTRQVLERIVQEKKMGLLYKWPKECRKAAVQALKSLGNNLVSGKL